MNIGALLTSAGINIAICVVLLSLYSILRKQPSNVVVYFPRKLASGCAATSDPFWLERLIPSASWILKAWEETEENLLAIGGLDSVVFIRMIVFSIRMFSIAAVICTFFVLPVNYHGQDRIYKQISSESLDVFTIANVKEASKWLWVHCLALYVISCSACALLYFEYKKIAKLRISHIAGSPSNRSYFTVLVRSIPRSTEGTYSDSVREFFTKHHVSSYLSHQMVYHCSTVERLMTDAEKMCKMLKPTSSDRHLILRCCGGHTNSFKILSGELDGVNRGINGCGNESTVRKKECPSAFVFFKSRYAAVAGAQVIQSSNPMSWVTDLAPEPCDVYWSTLALPYRQLWLRKIGTLLASIAFMFVFLLPVTFVQSLTQLDKLQKKLPFLRGLFRERYISQVVTGYLPSVILLLFLYVVPPMMMLFSAVEGSISRSGRKRSACCKVLYFTIWNVFFVNVFTGSIINQLSVFSSVKDIPSQLAKAVPAQVSFFMTYVLTSGWASIAIEVIQLCPLVWNQFIRHILRKKDESFSDGMSFPYHTEVPRVLLFGFLGFACSILAPLILPLLLVYFFLAYLVYRNQIINVYIPKYESGGQYWPIAHNTTIFSLVLAQIIALGVFGMKKSPVASGFTVPLIIGTLLFHEYCRHRFRPIFRKSVAEVLIEMDQKDEQSGKLEEIYQQLQSAYLRIPAHDLCSNHPEGGDRITDLEGFGPEEKPAQENELSSVQCSSDGAESSDKK